MIRKYLSALIAFAVLVALPAPGSMQSPTVLPADIAARAADGPVRVIVRLGVPAVAEDSLRDANAVAVQRAAIGAAQEATLEALSGHAEAPTRFATLPAFAVTTDADGLARLAASPTVVAIEPDRLLDPLLLDTPSIVRANVLWDHGVEAAGWNVAILDTGVEKSHSFFQNRITSEACYSTNSAALDSTSLCPGGASSSTAVESGINCVGIPNCDHGTAVAGVAAGRGSILSGMARSANIISIQVFSRVSNATPCGGGTGPCLKAFNSDVILALERVLALAGSGNAGRIGAVNLSVGVRDNSDQGLYGSECDGTDTVFFQAIANLRAAGIPVVVASGNNGSTTRIVFPACMSSAIGVGATSKADFMSLSSNRSALLKLVAPGEAIRTSSLGDSFTLATGTSLAAAHVSGAWTLLKSSNPTASVDAVLQGLQQTGVRIFDSSSGVSYRRIALDRAEGSMGPAGSPTVVLVSVFGTTVTATWDPPFDGSAPTGYRVEITSLLTGATVGNVNVGTNRTFFTTLQNGFYRLHVRSITSGDTGPASSDISFAVGGAGPFVPPHAPLSLRAEVNDRRVSLVWNVPGESAPVTSFIVEAGSISGLANFGAFDTGTNASSVVIDNVQPGTYFVRVRARNAHGTSGPSNEVRVDVVGTGCVLPLPPGGLNATVVGALVTLNWTPPAVVGTITGYIIEVGSTPGLSNIAALTVGPSTVVTASAVPGTYFVRIRAQSTCGLTGPSNEVTVVVP